MKLIFCKSNMPLSVLIRLGLNEPVSHFAIVFDNGIVFHSDLLGSHVDWYDTFKKKHTIVYELDYALPVQDEEKIYQSILDQYDGRGYDYGAFFYFMYCGLKYRLFNIPLPNKNDWESGSRFLCTELASTLPSTILPVSVISEDLGIISPYRLYLQLKAAKE